MPDDQQCAWMTSRPLKDVQWPKHLRSSLDGVRWPCPVPGPAASSLAMQFQLTESQWWSAAALQTWQLRQAHALLRHAQTEVPYYREHIKCLPDSGKLTPDDWLALPVLTRAALQEAGDSLHSDSVPPGHGRIDTTSTSGSTGRPVRVRRTALCLHYWHAFTLREHLWHNRDFSGRLAAIRYRNSRANETGQVIKHDGWGPSTNAAFDTGPSFVIPSRLDVAAQFSALRQISPHYLLTYPSTLRALAQHSLEVGIDLPDLKEVRTFGEALADDTREWVRRAWGVELVDAYSADEVGNIAHQCPVSGHYHVLSEDILLEVLDDNDHPCAPGETGRVVVTPLHNFAMPLVRYALGDYAEVGEACACGRGLPVLRRILGRTRNLVVLPDGRRMRPSMGILDYERIAPVHQAQLIQRTVERIDVRLVVSTPLNSAQESELSTLIRGRLGYAFDIHFEYPDEIARTPGGKFEDFMSEVSDD